MLYSSLKATFSLCWRSLRKRGRLSWHQAGCGTIGTSVDEALLKGQRGTVECTLVLVLTLSLQTITISSCLVLVLTLCLQTVTVSICLVLVLTLCLQTITVSSCLVLVLILSLQTVITSCCLHWMIVTRLPRSHFSHSFIRSYFWKNLAVYTFLFSLTTECFLLICIVN